MQNKNKEGVTEEATSVNSEQLGYKNNSLVYNNIESNRYKTCDTEESETVCTSLDEFIENLVVVGQILEDFFEDIISGPCDYIFTSPNSSSRQGINQSYWTTFARVIKRSGY